MPDSRVNIRRIEAVRRSPTLCTYAMAVDGIAAKVTTVLPKPADDYPLVCSDRRRRRRSFVKIRLCAGIFCPDMPAIRLPKLTA